MKIHYLFFYVAFCFSISFQAQEIETPKGWEVLDQLTGDLNNDNIHEKVIIYDTSDSINLAKIQEIQIFKKDKEAWVLWKSS